MKRCCTLVLFVFPVILSAFIMGCTSAGYVASESAGKLPCTLMVTLKNSEKITPRFEQSKQENKALCTNHATGRLNEFKKYNERVLNSEIKFNGEVILKEEN